MDRRILAKVCKFVNGTRDWVRNVARGLWRTMQRVTELEREVEQLAGRVKRLEGRGALIGPTTPWPKTPIPEELKKDAETLVQLMEQHFLRQLSEWTETSTDDVAVTSG